LYKERTIKDFLNKTHNQANMNVHVHISYYYDTGEANDVDSGLGYWS